MQSLEELDLVLSEHVANKKAQKNKKQSVLESKQRKEAESHKDKSKMHSDMLSANKDLTEANKEIAQAIDDSSVNLSKILSNIGDRVGISLEVPDLLEGDKISESIESSSKRTEGLLKELAKNLSKIKLEIQPTELAPHTKKLTDNATINNDKLLAVVKTAIRQLNQSISEIQLVQDNPIEWEFKVSRDKKGYIESVNAVAYYGEV